MGNQDTDNIEYRIKTSATFGEFLDDNADYLLEVHPGRYINDQINRKGLNKKDIINKVNLNTGYAYEILREEKRPERDKLLCFIFALSLDINEAQVMLKRCRYAALYAKNPRDSAIMFCISRRKSLVETNILLDEHGFDIL